MFLPIPAVIVTLAGLAIFGPALTIIISLIAIMLGSLTSFWIGKKWGKKLTRWIFGEETSKKWENLLTNGKYAFALMLLFPLFPDDMLCMIAGVTDMKYSFFLIVNLIARPVAIISTCYFLGGYIIPFKGWGIPIWILLVILMIIAFVISIKYQSQIENFIRKINDKLLGKSKQRKLEKISSMYSYFEMQPTQDVIALEEKYNNKKIEIENSNNTNKENSKNLRQAKKYYVSLKKIIVENTKKRED